MHIVLDANVIISGNYWTSRRIQELVSAAGVLGYQIHVPHVALDETIGKYSRDVADGIRSLKSALDQLSRLLRRELELPSRELDPQEISNAFRNSLIDQFSASNVNLLNYPTISHEQMVERATSRIRPFDEHGSGYRDTLVWFTVLELATQVEGQIILVTEGQRFPNRTGQFTQPPYRRFDIEWTT